MKLLFGAFSVNCLCWECVQTRNNYIHCVVTSTRAAYWKNNFNYLHHARQKLEGRFNMFGSCTCESFAINFRGDGLILSPRRLAEILLLQITEVDEHLRLQSTMPHDCNVIGQMRLESRKWLAVSFNRINFRKPHFIRFCAGLEWGGLTWVYKFKSKSEILVQWLLRFIYYFSVSMSTYILTNRVQALVRFSSNNARLFWSLISLLLTHIVQ